MKKLLILFLALVIVGGLAFGGPINITLSATSTLKWRLVGTLMDDQPGAIVHALGGVTVAQSSEGVSKAPTVAPTSTGDFELAPATLYLTLDAQDANKVSIVRAQSTIDMTTDVAPLTFGDDLFSDIFHYIEFPNAVPGMVGVMLHKAGTLSTAQTTASSKTSYPNVITTITPIKDATIVVGLAVAPGILYEKYWASAPTATAVVTYVVAAVAPTASATVIVENLGAVTGGTLYRVTTITPAAYGSSATNSTEIGNYMDFAASLDATYKLALGEKDSVTIGFGTIYDTAWGSGVVTSTTAAGANKYTKDAYKAYVAKQVPVAGEDKVGWASIPFGLTVGLAMSGLTVDVAAQARLVTGFDALNVDNSVGGTGLPVAFAMPLYAKLAASYKLPMGDITITPSLTFKYSSDFWKWWYNSDYTVGAFEYKGLVVGADIIGRPMSLAVSVPVVGIAKMLDVTASATLGLGDAKARHGSYVDDDGNNQLGSIVYSTLADYIAVATAAGNNVVADMIAYKLGLVATVKPIPEVLVKNEFYYNHDGFGVVGASSATRWKTYLTRLQDIVTGEYSVKVADAVAATFYGVFTFTNRTFADSTTTYKVVDYATPVVNNKDVPTATTLTYEIGVKAVVKY